MKEIYLSVIIPSYDEMANLQKGVLDKVVHFLGKKKHPYEVIVVDDGSKDGSDTFVEKFAQENEHVHLLRNHHQGKAGAVTAGMLHAKGKYILFTDMDQATPIEELDKLLPYFSQGYDVVIGSRKGRKGAPWTRKFMANSMITLRTLIVGIHGIKDTQCGFKIFTHDAAQEIFQKMHELHHGFKNISGSNVTAGFDVEMLYLARKMKYRIKEVSVTWLYVETRRVNPLRDSIEGLTSLIAIRMNRIKGKY